MLSDDEYDALNDSVIELECLWDMLSDAIEGGRLTEADIPDDYEAFVEQMVSCEGARYRREQVVDEELGDDG